MGEIDGLLQGGVCIDKITRLPLDSLTNTTVTNPPSTEASSTTGNTTTTGNASTTGNTTTSNAENSTTTGNTTTGNPQNTTTGNGSTGSTQTSTTQQPAVVTPAPVFTPAAGGAAPLAPLTTTGAFTPASLATAMLPAGMASNIFSAGAYNPGLLLGAPGLQNAAAGLFNAKGGSSVNTVSQAQALANDGEGGYGTPVTVGVIILACLIAFAVRHRIISRMKGRELPSDTAGAAGATPADEAKTEVVAGGPGHSAPKERELTTSGR